MHASHAFVTYRDGRGAILRNLYTSFSANAAMLWLIWPTRQENHFLQAGNFKKVAANAEIHRAGLSDSLLAGRLVGPDTARAIHGGF